MRNFYERIAEITDGMQAGLVRIKDREPECSSRWENAVKEAREMGGQSVL